MDCLDRIVFRQALAKASRLMKRGYGPEEAAEEACAGAWTEYRKQVLNVLLAREVRKDAD